MFLSRILNPRFFLSYGLLILAVIVPLIIFFKPVKKHVLETQNTTSYMARSRVLSYQTPNFKLLAQNMIDGHVFDPLELDDYSKNENYLLFYTKGADLFPNQFEFFYLKGICHFWRGEIPEAVRSLQESLRIDPVFFWGYYNLGLLELKYGQIDNAIALFSLAKKLPPQTTLMALHNLQAFYIIWRFMPDPEAYINAHLRSAEENINYFLSIALAVKNNHGADVHFDQNTWHPEFF